MHKRIRTGVGVLAVALGSALPPAMSQAQAPSTEQLTVTGRVLNAETLAPLAGVLVSLGEGGTAVLTAPDGRYTIVAPGSATLSFSMLGFSRHEEPVENRSEIDVALQPSALALDEVVAVGYATQQRATVSGSVSSINSEDIQRTSSTTTADMLVGKMAGINTRMTTNGGQAQFSGTAAFTGRVPQDGRPGAATVLQIRNMGEPLFVIDGVPQSSLEFNHLNSADIESISILKDASASVYGFRAANGVVLVTTKRGEQAQRPQLRLDGYFGWQNLIRERSQFGWANNAHQFKYSIIESEQNLGQPRSITPEEMELWRQGGPGYETYEAYPNFINRPNAPQWNLNGSLSGGGNGSRYYFSAGHVHQDYVMEDNSFSRTNFQSNLQTSPFDNFTIGTELRGRLETHLTVAITEQTDALNIYWQGIQSSWPFEDPWANGNRDYINGDVRYLLRSAGQMRRDIGGTQDQFRRNFSGSIWAEYKLPFGPTAKATYAHTVNNHQFDVHRYTFDAYRYDEETDTYEVWDTYQGQQRQHVRDQVKDNFVQVQVSHDGAIGAHTLSGVAAFELSGDEGTFTEVRSVPPTNFSHLIEQVDITSFLNDWYITRRASYVGRLNYDYNQKYLLEVLGRYDGSYLYAEGKRWAFFPGVSAGWRITEEPAVQRAVPWLTELKLRASWGQTGREQGVAPWDFLGGATFGEGTGSVFDDGQTTGIRPRGLPVTNLSWVTATSRNVGIDFALMSGRLSGEIDVFERRLTGLPAPRYDVVLPSEVGYTLPDENLESEANIGIEGIVRYSDRYGNLSYSIAPNATLARRKILDRYRPRYGNSWLQYRTGTEDRWAGTNFRYIQIGQFQSMDEIASHPVDHDGRGNTTLLPGDHIYEDVNNDGFIDELDMRAVAFGTDQTPILSYGLNGSFSYGPFTLNYDWAGGALYSALWGVYPYTSDHNGALANQSRWRRADPYDDNSEWIPGKFEPSRKGVNNHSSRRNSTFGITNVKYLRLKRLELGYQVPESLGTRLGVSAARAYTSVSNPFLIDNYGHTALDPEGTRHGHLYTTSMVANVGFSATLGSRQGPAETPVPVTPPTED